MSPATRTNACATVVKYDQCPSSFQPLPSCKLEPALPPYCQRLHKGKRRNLAARNVAQICHRSIAGIHYQLILPSPVVPWTTIAPYYQLLWLVKRTGFWTRTGRNGIRREANPRCLLEGSSARVAKVGTGKQDCSLGNHPLGYGDLETPCGAVEIFASRNKFRCGFHLIRGTPSTSLGLNSRNSVFNGSSLSILMVSLV